MYDIENSETAKIQYKDGVAKTQKDTLSLNFGEAIFSGTVYKDNICVLQTTNKKTDKSGKLCVRQMPFLAVDEITGEFGANGILGLGPSNDKRSYVNQLYYQGQIDEQVVGLNYENPADKTAASTVTFGYLDYKQVFGGEDGLNWYENIGVDHWAVLMSDVLYGDKDIQGSVGGKMALIDSGNRSI